MINLVFGANSVEAKMFYLVNDATPRFPEAYAIFGTCTLQEIIYFFVNILKKKKRRKKSKFLLISVQQNKNVEISEFSTNNKVKYW